MTSPVWLGARAVALWRGLPVPVCLLAHCEHSALGAAFLSRVNSSKVNTLAAGMDLASSGKGQSQASTVPAKIMEPGCAYSVVSIFFPSCR